MSEVDVVDSLSKLGQKGFEAVIADLEDVVEMPPCSNFVIKRRRKMRRRKMLAICKGNGTFKFIHLDKLMDKLEKIDEQESS